MSFVAWLTGRDEKKEQERAELFRPLLFLLLVRPDDTVGTVNVELSPVGP